MGKDAAALNGTYKVDRKSLDPRYHPPSEAARQALPLIHHWIGFGDGFGFCGTRDPNVGRRPARPDAQLPRRRRPVRHSLGRLERRRSVLVRNRPQSCPPVAAGETMRILWAIDFPRHCFTVTRVYDKQMLMELVRSRALKFGEFTLASGKKASYYLDGKQVTLDSFGARLVADGILDLLADELPLPDAVGGMAIGADPITAAVITMAGVRGQQMSGFLVRKEAKGHGTNRYVEGPVRPGQRVVIVEDVVTTGGSSLDAITRVEEFGLKVTRVIAIIDRMEGGRPSIRREGLSLFESVDDPRFRHPAAGVMSVQCPIRNSSWRSDRHCR